MNGQIYTGFTTDLKRRLVQHNNGDSIATKRYMPWELLYYEAYKFEKLARLREKRLKWNGNAIRELKKRIGMVVSKSGAGFTMVELLVVFALISILTGAGIGISQQAGRRQAVIQAAEGLATAMKMARANALAGKKDTATCGSNFLDGWRVVVLANGYTLEGVCGTVFFSKTTNYPSPVTNSPTPMVLFKPLGLGATAATITVSGSGVTQTVQVTGSGEVK